MSFSFITTALFAVSIVTNLTVEGVKKILTSMGKTFSSTVLAAVLSVLIAIGYCIAYACLYSVEFTASYAVQTLAFAYISFLVSTVGYDKVIEAFGKIFASKK